MVSKEGFDDESKPLRTVFSGNFPLKIKKLCALFFFLYYRFIVGLPVAGYRKIFIGGLSRETTLDTFVKYFGKYGEITDSVIMKDRFTGRPRGFGFITYADPAVVHTVIAETHIINGKQIESLDAILSIAILCVSSIPEDRPNMHKVVQIVEVMSVYVSNVPTTMAASEIGEEFKKFGKLKPDGVAIRTRKDIDACYEFVEFEDVSGVQNAIKILHLCDFAIKG